MGTALSWFGRYAEAAGALEHALAALGDADDVELAAAHVQLGVLHLRRGEHAIAREALLRAFDVASRLGTDELLAQSLLQLGSVAFFTGELKTAADLTYRSLAQYEHLEDRRRLADIHSNLGMIYRRGGQWQDATLAYQRALQLRQQIGDLNGIAICHNNIGELHRTRGDFGPAIAEFEKAIEIWETIGSPVPAGIARVGLAAARVARGEVAQGRGDLLAVQAVFADAGTTLVLPDLYRELAVAELAGGNLQAAADAVERPLAAAEAMGAKDQYAMRRSASVLGDARDEQIRADDRNRGRGSGPPRCPQGRGIRRAGGGQRAGHATRSRRHRDRAPTRVQCPRRAPGGDGGQGRSASRGIATRFAAVSCTAPSDCRFRRYQHLHAAGLRSRTADLAVRPGARPRRGGPGWLVGGGCLAWYDATTGVVAPSRVIDSARHWSGLVLTDQRADACVREVGGGCLPSHGACGHF